MLYLTRGIQFTLATTVRRDIVSEIGIVRQLLVPFLPSHIIPHHIPFHHTHHLHHMHSHRHTQAQSVCMRACVVLDEEGVKVECKGNIVAPVSKYISNGVSLFEYCNTTISKIIHTIHS